jgi:ParB-like chromosome segregation protein Spo0J
MDDRALLRDLKAAMDRTEDLTAAERAEAIEAVLQEHGATTADVGRLLGRARRQHRRELSGLAQRLDGLIEQREEMESTAEAVERFLREQRP